MALFPIKTLKTTERKCPCTNKWAILKNCYYKINCTSHNTQFEYINQVISMFQKQIF